MDRTAAGSEAGTGAAGMPPSDHLLPSRSGVTSRTSRTSRDACFQGSRAERSDEGCSGTGANGRPSRGIPSSPAWRGLDCPPRAAVAEVRIADPKPDAPQPTPLDVISRAPQGVRAAVRVLKTLKRRIERELPRRPQPISLSLFEWPTTSADGPPQFHRDFPGMHLPADLIPQRGEVFESGGGRRLDVGWAYHFETRIPKGGLPGVHYLDATQLFAATAAAVLPSWQLVVTDLAPMDLAGRCTWGVWAVEPGECIWTEGWQRSEETGFEVVPIHKSRLLNRVRAERVPQFVQIEDYVLTSLVVLDLLIAAGEELLQGTAAAAHASVSAKPPASREARLAQHLDQLVSALEGGYAKVALLYGRVRFATHAQIEAAFGGKSPARRIIQALRDRVVQLDLELDFVPERYAVKRGLHPRSRENGYWLTLRDDPAE